MVQPDIAWEMQLKRNYLQKIKVYRYQANIEKQLVTPSEST